MNAQYVAVSTDTLHWPWGIRGPGVALHRHRNGDRKAWLLARSHRLRIPYALAWWLTR